jgi:hypothetical protein
MDKVDQTYHAVQPSLFRFHLTNETEQLRRLRIFTYLLKAIIQFGCLISQ